MTEEIREWVRRRSLKNGFALECGVEMTEVEDERAVMEMTITEKHLNPLGRIHGGVYFTLADCACGIACCTDGRVYVTQSSGFNFLRSGTQGDVLRAEARVRKRGRSTAYVEVELTIEGQLMATGSFQFFCLGPEVGKED